MKRAPLSVPGVSALLVLFLSANDAGAELLVFQDGSRMEILRYEIAGDVVVLTARDGKLLSVPRAEVDLDRTTASNRAPETLSLSDPAGEALLLLDLRRMTDEIVLAARGAGEAYLAADPRDPRAPLFRAALREGFEPDRFYRIAADSFRERSTGLAWNEILPWLRSALVRKLNRVSTDDFPNPSSEELRRELASSPPSLARLELVERLDRASGRSATAVAMEITLLKTLLAGMNSGLDPARRASPVEIERAAERYRPEFLAAARERVRLSLLHRYQNVEDRELREYLSFLESSGGVSLGRSVLESLFAAMEDAAQRSGELLSARVRDLAKTKV
jgi:hypothetical protein